MPPSGTTKKNPAPDAGAAGGAAAAAGGADFAASTAGGGPTAFDQYANGDGGPCGPSAGGLAGTPDFFARPSGCKTGGTGFAIKTAGTGIG